MIFSPSNLGSYRDCPRRFQGQSVTKEIKWKASAQKSRGTQVHEAIEEYIRTRDDSLIPQDVDRDFVRNRVGMIPADATVLIEHEMGIDKKMQPAGWWDAYLRAKADLIVIPKDGELVHIYDIKTGKKWDSEAFQLRIEAIIALCNFKRPKVHYAFWYVDSGDITDGVVDFSKGLWQVQDIITLIKNADMSLKNNYFPPKKNKFCRWCDFFETEKCGL